MAEKFLQTIQWIFACAVSLIFACSVWSQDAFPDVTLADVSRHLNLMEANPANAETVNAATFNAVNDISTLDRQPELPASPCFARASIASMAARQSVLARLLRKHANSQNNSAAKSHKIKKDPCAYSWLVSLESLQADREAQKSAEQALRAHYAILGIEQAIPIQQAMLLAIDQALAEQSSAIENGLPVSNPTQLSILRLQTLDKLEQSQLSLRTLRASLSQLIPSEVACSYHPCLENEDWQPSDLCDEIQDGLRRRCDLQAIELLIMHGSLEHLELSRGLLGSLVGLPQIGSALAKKSWKSLLGLDHREKEEELCRIKGLLRDAKRFLEMQISSEIETAWHEWKSNEQRTLLAKEIGSLRELRFQQVAAMGELGRPLPAEFHTAKLEWLASRIDAIQRQTEQSIARVRLESATGQLPCR